MPSALSAPRFRRVLAATLPLALIALTLPASAQDLHGNPSSFNLFNDTKRVMLAYAVELSSGHYTENLLAESLAPGTGLTLDLAGMLDDTCDHVTRIVWSDGAVQELSVPYCTLAAVFVADDGVTFD